MTSTPAYYLVQNQSGMLLNGADPLTICSLAGDDCMWLRNGDTLSCATSGIIISITGSFEAGNGETVYQLKDGNDHPVADSIGFFLAQGPDKLPSAHLKELQATGFTVLANVLDRVAIETLKERITSRRVSQHADEALFDGHFWMKSSLLWSPEVARASCHPVALWLLQQYLETDEIHFCHQPILTTLKPAKDLLGTFPESGWHSDYPYHPGVFPNDHWPENPVCGAQFNVCIDDFTAETGGTQYVPCSHLTRATPPLAFNTGGTRMGEGLHKDVKQMIAPAGAALIYDARTWHRACDELNISGQDRVGLLNAVAPAWVLPMMDKRSISDRYLASDAQQALTQRERNDIIRLCHGPIADAPVGMPVLSTRALKAS